MKTPEDLPKDIAALRAALIAKRARAARIGAELAVAKAKASDDQALIAHQRLQIAKLTRELYGQRSERSVQLVEPAPPRATCWAVEHSASAAAISPSSTASRFLCRRYSAAGEGRAAIAVKPSQRHSRPSRSTSRWPGAKLGCSFSLRSGLGLGLQ